MPQPPINATVLYLDNTTTVDTGGAVDVRALAVAAGSGSSQSVAATNAQDNADRTFDPGAFAATTVLDPQTMQKLGWAIPFASFTPSDSRCKPFLAAGGATVRVFVQCNRSGQVPVGVSTVTFEASLWKYNPSTDTGTLIDGGVSPGAAYDMTLLTTTLTLTADIPLSWATGVTFESGESLYLQIGMNTGTLGDPLALTTTYEFFLFEDTTTFLTFTGTSMRVACTESAPAGLTLAGQRVVRSVGLGRADLVGAMTLGGAFDTALTLARSFVGTLTLGGAYARGLILLRSFSGGLTLAGARQAWTISLGRADLKAVLDLNGQRVVRAITKVPYAGALTLGGTYSRALTLARSFTGTLTLNAAFARVIIFGRHFIGQLALGASWAVCISQAILNRMVSGGTTIIKKLFFIGD